MTTDERRAIGEKQLEEALYRKIAVEGFVVEMGLFALTTLIEKVLDEHYPADIFGDGSLLYPTWAGEHAGTDLEPGVRWAALLRHAIKEAFPKEPA